ncbi:MAG: Outer membrane protein, OmpA/MotB family [Pseudolabrys sp.]|nr:Outer membrane protein, OmpA/MotB family [Pseudolabrys sp.]
MRLNLTLVASAFAVGSASFVLCPVVSAAQPAGPIILAQQQPSNAPEQKKPERQEKAPPPHRPAPPQQHAPQAPKPPAAARPEQQRPAGPPPGVHPPQQPHVNAPQAPKPAQPPQVQPQHVQPQHVQPAQPPASAQPKIIQAPAQPNTPPPPPNTGRPNLPPNAGHPVPPPNGARPDQNRGPNNAAPNRQPGPNNAPPTNPAAQQQNNKPGPAAVPQQGRGPQPPNGNAAQNQQNQPGATGNGPKRIDQVRAERKETKEGNRTIIREDNRTIVRQNNTTIIRHDDTDRFRRNARNVQVQRQGNVTRTEIVRPNGERIVTETDASGRPLRRVRFVNGRQYVLFDNREDHYRHRDGRYGNGFGFIVVLPPPVIHIPRDRYIVDVDQAPPALIYDTLVAPPVEQIAEPFTLDEVLYNDTVRERMPRLDLDTITFQTGSWEITPDQAQLLAPIAEAMRRAIARNPNEVYLIEGHTDAVGSPEDNLSLSDRRAEAVAEVLTSQFGIPPENMVTQGYGEQYLKVPTQGPSQANRRVTIRRITPLLARQ